MGRYTKAYTGTLAIVCAGSIAVAVRASDKAAKVGELDAKADRWERWAGNERLRDERAYARFNEVARQYRQLARQVERSQRRLQREIAMTRSTHRRVVIGQPIITYVRVRKLVPAVSAPSAAVPVTATGAAPVPVTATQQKSVTGTGQKPLTPTKPKKATPSAPGGSGSGGAPATGTGTPADPGGAQGGGSATASPPPAANPPAGGTTTTPPPATVTAPVNTKLPAIIGVAQSSKTISADPGSWTGNPTSFTYQWQRCDAAGANCVVVGSGQSYTCVPLDIDKTMRVAVEAKNSAGSAVAVSAPSPKTKPS